MTIYIILGIVIILIIWFVSTYNKLVNKRNKVEEAFSTMDVYLKKRYDLIPNIVETVKGYASHEKDTLESVIAARNSCMSASGSEDIINAENQLAGTLKTLFSLTESYPDLKANTNFLNLQNELKNIEDEISSSRKYYNAVCNVYNILCESIPSNIVAGICNFKKKPLFEISEGQRENVKVSFE